MALESNESGVMHRNLGQIVVFATSKLNEKHVLNLELDLPGIVRNRLIYCLIYYEEAKL